MIKVNEAQLRALRRCKFIKRGIFKNVFCAELKQINRLPDLPRNLNIGGGRAKSALCLQLLMSKN